MSYCLQAEPFIGQAGFVDFVRKGNMGTEMSRTASGHVYCVLTLWQDSQGQNTVP